MSDKLPAPTEIYWIRKTMHIGFSSHDDVPIGTIYAWEGEKPAPPGWEKVTPPEVMLEALDGLEVQERCFPTCFDSTCDGIECLTPGICEETNRCVIALMRKRLDTQHDILVGFRLGIGVTAKAVRAMALGAREAGDNAKADQLEATAEIIAMLAK